MKYVCPCGYVYDPELGDPDNGIAGKIFRTIGYVPSAVLTKARLKKNKLLWGWKTQPRLF